MEILRLVITIIFILICIGLTVLVLLQEGKSAGLSGSISGIAETYWGKNKGRSVEGKLERATTFLAIAFMVLAIVLNINF
ncbi:MAG: preprotein translocase subunit SecG [Lachnospiraceae bacterium]|nr:preprotein translocase subunit SecG [Candidatus Fimimorpha excrementavium]